MKYIYSLILLTAISSSLYSQDTIQKKPVQKYKRNTIFIELLGSGGLYSLNYDVLTKNKGKLKQSLGIGISYFPSGLYRQTNVPLSYNFLYGKRKGHIELGGVLNAYYLSVDYSSGLAALYVYRTELFVIGNSIKIGYRYQRPNGGFFFKTNLIGGANYYAISPNSKFESLVRPNLYFSIGLSLGYTF